MPILKKAELTVVCFSFFLGKKCKCMKLSLESFLAHLAVIPEPFDLNAKMKNVQRSYAH